MKKGSISLDEYMKATKRLEKMLLEANELLRSAYAIAQRNGEKTNWEAFRGQLKNALDAQHESGLTQRAPDACPACGGSGIEAEGVNFVRYCVACDGWGKRR